MAGFEGSFCDPSNTARRNWRDSRGHFVIPRTPPGKIGGIREVILGVGVDIRDHIFYFVYLMSKLLPRTPGGLKPSDSTSLSIIDHLKILRINVLLKVLARQNPACIILYKPHFTTIASCRHTEKINFSHLSQHRCSKEVNIPYRTKIRRT